MSNDIRRSLWQTSDRGQGQGQGKAMINEYIDLDQSTYASGLEGSAPRTPRENAAA